MKVLFNIKTIGALALILGLTTSYTLAQKPSPEVLPFDSAHYGKTYAEWSGAWWQWALSIPVDMNPVSDLTGTFAGVGQSGPVWFLAGTWSSSTGPTTRTVTVPPGKALFFPIINTVWVNAPELGDDPWSDAQRDFARSVIGPFIDDAYNLRCEIDGVAVANLQDYRCQTPDGSEYMVTFPDNNIWGLPKPATYGPSVDDGICVMLAPLPPGQHTIRFAAESFWFGTPTSLDVTYYIKVEQGANTGAPRIIPPNSVAYGKTLTEWLYAYWQWFYGGADPAASVINGVQLLPLPASEQLAGSWTPADPAYLKGTLEITLPAGTPFVLPEFSWVGERYAGYPAVPDDVPMDNAVALQDVSVNLTIDGKPVLLNANKAAFYIPPTYFDPIVMYPAPSSYGSVAAVFYQGVGFVSQPLPVGTHVIRLFEPFIIKPGDYPGLPDGIGLIYDNTWTINVVPRATKPAKTMVTTAVE